MSMVEVIAYLLLVLTLIPLFLQATYFLVGYRGGRRGGGSSGSPALKSLTVIVPVRGERPEIVGRLLASIKDSGYPPELLEVIVVSDDPVWYFEAFKRKLEDSCRGIQYPVKIVRRGSVKGYKAGALNYALNLARGEYVVVLDSDSKVSRGLLEALLAPLVRGDSEATTSWWEALNKGASLLADALDATQSFLFKSLFAGRNRLTGNTAIAGSGCAFERRFIAENRWDENYILEDVELGIRLSLAGMRIRLVESPRLKLEVPSSYEALKIQQYRWANGAGQLLREYLGRIWRSRIGFLRKLDHTLYLLQYGAPLAQLCLNILGLLMLVFGVGLGAFTTIIVLFIGWTLLYSASYIMSAVEDGYSLGGAARMLGRTSGVSASMSVDLAYSYLKGMLGSRVRWRVTPKGETSNSKFSTLRGEYIHMILSIAGLIMAAYRGCLPAVLWYALNLLPLVYVVNMLYRRKM